MEKYKPTYATCTGKEKGEIVSSPGLFRSGGEKVGTFYRAYFRSDSGKMFFEDFNPAFWRELKKGIRVYFENHTAQIV